MIPRARAAAAALVAVGLLTACAHHVVGGHVTVRTVVVTPTPTPPSTTAPASTPASSSTPRPKPKPPAPVVKRLPGTCRTLFDAATIDKVMGQKLRGDRSFGLGGADPSSDRLSYIDCKYGVIPGKAAAIEIRVSLYRTVRASVARVAATVADFEQHGATATQTHVGNRPATLLLGANLLTYGPTLVKSAKQRTIAVTLRPGWHRAGPLLSRAALLAFRRTSP